MRQKRPDIDVSLSLLVNAFLCVVNNGNKPIPILTEVEDNVTIDIVGIPDRTTNFCEILPPHRFDDCRPGVDFVCGIWISIAGYLQMPSGDKVHYQSYFTSCEDCKWLDYLTVHRGGG
jgi:hypothetical protein